MIIKRKVFSGFSESNPSGTSYVQDDQEHVYVLDEADRLLEVVDNSCLGKVNAVNKKTTLFKRAIRPTKEYILYKREKAKREKEKQEELDSKSRKRKNKRR